MKIEGFTPIRGHHCETTATRNLLQFTGIQLSEPMLFGIGQGLGFIYWDMKNMSFPFIGGRIKQDNISVNVVTNLGLKMDVHETSSKKIAWESVKNNIDSGIPVGLKLDCFYLDYFTNKIHFAAHYVAMYGYDNEFAYLVDTVAQGTTVKTTLTSLGSARNEKGPMSSRNLSYTITKQQELPDLRTTVIKAIRTNADDFLSPPIRNIGYKGIEKAGKEIKKWLSRSDNPEEDLKLTATLMEKAGTGGAIFRNIYRDFLKEADDLLDISGITLAHKKFCDIAMAWNEVSSLIYQAGETLEPLYLNQAADLVLSLSKQEKEAMEILRDI